MKSATILTFLIPALVGADLAEGVKIGEVTPTSATVWVRTSQGGRQTDGTVDGAAGEVSVSCQSVRSQSAITSAATGYSHVFQLSGLKPATRYACSAQTGSGTRAPFEFTTAPDPKAPARVSFNTVTGLMYKDLDDPRGYKIFDAMFKQKPSFLVFTGDSVYYDNEPPRATTPAVARYHWQRMYSLPRHVALLSSVPSYWEKDDHDILSDDCWPGMDPDFMKPMTFAEGLRLFAEQTPLRGLPYRSFRWGRWLEVWLLEGREFRSPNNAPDGPSKTILGDAQKQWLKRTVEASDAKWKIIISPTPWVGPDRGAKGDNYANKAFSTEGGEMRKWAASVKNLFIATGDRHWQYHSVDPQTKLEEFSCGPASDEHAGGTPGENKEIHRFHRVKGGYLNTEVTSDGRLLMRLMSVTGEVAYEREFN